MEQLGIMEATHSTGADLKDRAKGNWMEKVMAENAIGGLDPSIPPLEKLRLISALPTEVEMKLGDGAVLKTSQGADTKLSTPGRWMKQLHRWGLGK